MLASCSPDLKFLEQSLQNQAQCDLRQNRIWLQTLDPKFGNWHWRKVSNLFASLVMSSMNSSCAFSGTFSTSMVNGLLARVNGVSGKLGKYLEIPLQEFLSVLWQKVLFYSLFPVQCHFPQRKLINSGTCKFYFHPIVFCQSWSFNWNARIFFDKSRHVAFGPWRDKFNSYKIAKSSTK